MLLILILIITNNDFTDSQRNISNGRNIVYGKEFSYCGNNKTSILTDGDLLVSFTLYTPGCRLHVDFGKIEYLKYMILFTEETGSDPGHEHGLDVLIIDCTRHRYASHTCGGISTPIRMIKNLENGVHVSFMNGRGNGISMRAVISLKLSEIEIYIRDNVTHRGCFSDVSGNISFTFNGFKKCQTDCEKNAFGISKPLRSCFCLDEIDFENEVSLSECSETCDDESNNKCGGSNSHSIYIQDYHLPVFSGCRHGINVKIHDVPIRNLTFSKCVRFCGLLLSFFWEGKCGCTDDYNLIYCARPNITCIADHNYGMCDIPCDFDEENACGGEDGYSLYRNCGLGNDKPTYCDKLLNCKRAVFDHHGVCTHGCKSGFEGKHCMSKVSDPILDEIEEPDEEIELIETTSMMITSDTQESISDVTTPDTQESMSMVISSDTQESMSMMTSPDTIDSSTDSNTTTIKNKSVRVMVDYIFSIWVAETFLLILF